MSQFSWCIFFFIFVQIPFDKPFNHMPHACAIVASFLFTIVTHKRVSNYWFFFNYKNSISLLKEGKQWVNSEENNLISGVSVTFGHKFHLVAKMS